LARVGTVAVHPSPRPASGRSEHRKASRNGAVGPDTGRASFIDATMGVTIWANAESGGSIV